MLSNAARAPWELDGAAVRDQLLEMALPDYLESVKTRFALRLSPEEFYGRYRHADGAGYP